MKQCPYCAEQIQDTAIKCKHCGEFLEKRQSQKWYFRSLSMVILFLCVGPFMLPLVWIHPRLTVQIKAIITVGILVISVAFGVVFIKAFQSVIHYYDTLSQYL